MITKEALYHESKSNYAYGYDSNTLHLRFRAKKGEVKKATLRLGDPYIWEKGGGGGNLNGEGAYGWKADFYEMRLEAKTLYHDYFFVEVPQDTKRNRYAFIIEDEDELLLFGEKEILTIQSKDPSKESALANISNFFCFPYLNEMDILKVPKWAKSTIWYQIFPDRFCNGDPSNDPKEVMPWESRPTMHNFMGGDLQGVMDRLDYLHDLGISGIYFCPIFKGDTNHKYETVDYMQIDPAFGTNELFKELVQKAHALGIRIMLDGVFNHTGHQHPFFQDVVNNGEKSKYKDWYCIHKYPVTYGNYETFATVGHMPKINMENPETMEYFLEVGRYWVREFGIDGWRLDVANEIGHVFWRKFREEVRKINPEVLIVGEIWHDALPWLRGDQFDTVMHYPLMDACMKYFIKDQMKGEDFEEAINKILISYPVNVTENTFNLLGSHDTSRLLAEANEEVDKFKLAYAYLFTHSGSPMIYYGDEIGMTGSMGHGQEDHRKCMVWDETRWNRDLHEFMKELIRIRKENSDLQAPTIDWIDTSKENVIVYVKKDTLVLINKAKQAVSYELDDVLHPRLTDFRKESTVNLRTQEEILIKDQIHIPPMDYIIVKKRVPVS